MAKLIRWGRSPLGTHIIGHDVFEVMWHAAPVVVFLAFMTRRDHHRLRYLLLPRTTFAPLLPALYFIRVVSSLQGGLLASPFLCRWNTPFNSMLVVVVMLGL